MTPISPIEPIKGLVESTKLVGCPNGLGPLNLPVGASEVMRDFSEVLQDTLRSLAHVEQNYNELSKKVVTGQPVDIHRVMIAAEEMNIAFNLVLQVRNKVIEAYQEMMRMQV